MIHDWQVFDDTHQACKRCGLRLWRKGAGAWNAVTANGVPAPFGLLPDGSELKCVRPRNLLPGLVVIDYTGDPDVHPGCERFMHRIRDEHDPPSSALAVPGGAPTACGFPAVAWELGPPRLHLGWTWCLDCYPDRAGDGARQRMAPPAHVARYEAELRAREERGRLQGQRAKATREANARLQHKAATEAKRLARARARKPLRYCYCPQCAGGWPSQLETIAEIKSVRRRPQGVNPR
jgi:hypothetical protein